MRSVLYGITTAAALLLLSSGVAAPPSFACGFDGLLGDGFSAEHPKSIAVAFAISDAVAGGIVSKTAMAPTVQGSQGYWRAVGRIRSFQNLLSASGIVGAEAPGISLLFVDSKLWSKLTPSPQGYALEVHTSGASPEDVVVVTSETIFASVLDGSMPIEKALDLGLVVIDGKQDKTAALRTTMLTAADRAKAGVVPASPAMPIRLFGPAR